MDPALLELLQSMPPEQLSQILGLGTLDERSGALEQQLQMADALRGSPSMAARHGTVGGAIGAGIGDIVNKGLGQYQANQAQAGMERISSQRDVGRKEYLRALMGQLRKQPVVPVEGAGTAGMGDLMPDLAFGMG